MEIVRPLDRLADGKKLSKRKKKHVLFFAGSTADIISLRIETRNTKESKRSVPYGSVILYIPLDVLIGRGMFKKNV